MLRSPDTLVINPEDLESYTAGDGATKWRRWPPAEARGTVAIAATPPANDPADYTTIATYRQVARWPRDCVYTYATHGYTGDAALNAASTACRNRYTNHRYSLAMHLPTGRLEPTLVCGQRPDGGVDPVDDDAGC